MRSAVPVSAAIVVLATAARGFVQAPPTCMTAGRAGAARTRARTSTARMMERSRRISPLFSAGEEIPAAATEPVAAAEPTTTTEAEGGAEGATEEVEETKPLSELEIAKMEKLAEIERLRAKEVFITEKTGIYECTQCSFRYDPAQSGQGALPGTAFEDLPSTWLCPVCKSPKETFVAEIKTIAGFEDNQNYGFGTNSMTGSQKNLLIFGSLAAFFVLFLAGYALD